MGGGRYENLSPSGFSMLMRKKKKLEMGDLKRMHNVGVITKQ